MNKLHVKKDDQVVVIAGKSKGTKGKVMVALPKENRVIVQNANMVTRHKKPRRQGEPGGRIQQEGTIHASNVMLVCPHCGKPTRVGHVYEVKEKGGKQVKTKLRVCKQAGCGKTFE
ncbi:50S ribosomal protein L24 [Christensenellaceae bacterium OttesenSCG-928-L17]|nr:50S ribosomal protein L24 [Christensenellaceae bacterium OttesenSCG-928-L17]